VLDVRAFLSTPVMAAVVAGVLGVSLVLSASPAVAAPAGVPQPFIGPDPVGGGSSLDTVARLDGVALLDELVRLTPSERTEFLELHPETVTQLTTAPPPAAAVTAWWDRTLPVARAALIADLPAVVGNLEGMPYAVRDRANRAFLTETVFAIHAQLDAGVGRAMEDELRTRLKMLGAVEQSLRIGESGERRSLVSLDVTGQGRAVVAVGDLAEADYVTFFVPGMYVGVADQLVDWTAWADNSQAEQEAWLERLGTPGEVATVAWIGYHTPTLVNIAGLDLAYQGRDALTGSLQGLDAVRDLDTVLGAQGASAPASATAALDAKPYVTVVAHSYGSTAALMALERHTVTVDALALMGSPGSAAQSVAGLAVAHGNVFVGEAPMDPIVNSAFFGSDPGSPSYGAQRMGVGGAVDPLTHVQLAGSTGHNEYFTAGTECMRNLAMIGIDRGDLVLGGGTATSTDASSR